MRVVQQLYIVDLPHIFVTFLLGALLGVFHISQFSWLIAYWGIVGYI